MVQTALAPQLLEQSVEGGAEKGREARLELQSWEGLPNKTSHARLTQMCVHVWVEPKPLVRFGARTCVFQSQNWEFDSEDLCKGKQTQQM